MGEAAILVERDEADVPLELLHPAGTTGLSPVVAIRDGDTNNSWLDFNDNTFKTVGWTTRQAALTEISATNAPGKYVLQLDLSAVTIPAGTHFLVAEYDSGAGEFAQDILQLVASSKDIPGDVGTTLSAAHGAGTWGDVAVLAAIVALNDLDIADIQTALTAQGYTAARAVELSEILDHLKNRMEWDFTGATAQLILYDRAGTTELHRWAMNTNAGEKVTTQLGTQTKRATSV